MSNAVEEFPFAVAYEKKAKTFGRKISEQVYGVKCWYSDARLIEDGAKRVFVGINPGGSNADRKSDIDNGYLARPYAQPGYNAWLDEKEWLGSGSKHQAAVRQAFEAMFGERWETILRRTACLNIAPFRTPGSGGLPDEAWSWSVDWFTEVLEHISPRLILCNGSGNKNSPWSVMNKKYELEQLSSINIRANGFIKQAYIKQKGNPLHGARVVAMPLLVRFGGESLYQQLESMKPFR